MNVDYGLILNSISNALRMSLSADEAVHLQHSDLEVAGGTQGWVVKCLAGVRFAEPDILVHPDCLAVAKNIANPSKYCRQVSKSPLTLRRS